MTNSLYTEALADAKAIREAAEVRAKQQLVESMSPQIKLMVEQAILGENDQPDSNNQPSDDEEENAESEGSSSEDNDSSNDDGKGPTKNEQTYESLKLSEESDFANEEPVHFDPALAGGEDLVEDPHVTMESKRLINKLITKKQRKDAVVEKLDTLSSAIKRLRPAILLSESKNIDNIASQKLNKVMHSLVKEFKILSTSRILKSDKQLFETYLNLAQEFMSMYKRRRNRLNESIDDIFETDFIFEEEGDEDAEKSSDKMPDLDMSGDDSDSSDDMAGDDMASKIDSAISDRFEGLGAELADLIGDEEDSSDSSDDSDDMKSDDDSDDEASSADEAYSYGETDEGPSCEIDEDIDEDVDEAMDEGEVFLEIDENMLRDEIGKMRAMREGDAAAMDSHFGGGKKGKELFVDGEDLNKLDHVSSIKESARKVVRENRKLKADLNEHKKALSAMKGQLQEMNLFNAKLLYANKLMQNKDLSLKQQKHIVESLDNAKTLGEAKVLFEGLTKSLNKSSSRTGALTEGTSRRVLGTSSRSTRSAQPAKNRVEVDRWALLAGIKG